MPAVLGLLSRGRDVRLIYCAAMMALFSLPVMAAECGPREQVLTVLAGKFGEGRIGAGITPNGNIVESWVNLETGTWSITVRDANGLMCLVASGDNWNMLMETIPEGDPA